MRRSLANRITALGIAAVSIFVVACGSTSTSGGGSTNNSFSVLTSGTLLVSTWGTSQPEVVINSDGTMGGLDGALLKAFAKDHNLTLTLFQTTFASSILAVQQGKADMGAYFYWSDARAKQGFYSYPFFADTSVVITKAAFNYTGPDSLKGKRIGGIVGSVYTPYVQKAFPANLVSIYPDIPQEGQALLNGQVDALIESNTVATEPPLLGRTDIKLWPINANDFGLPASMLQNLSYNVVPCSNKPLADALDAELKKLVQSGAWDATLKANSAQSLNLTLARPTEGC
jgi:ABC-type amino acid transport substrate-binding protein